MADKKDAGPPPLEDPNSPEYVCVTCHNRVNSLCLACQEMALLRANFTTNERDNSDRYTPQAMSDSDMTDSAYDADTIIDSPNSSSSTLLLNLSDNSNDENDVSDNNVNEEEVEILEEPAAAAPAALMPRRRPIQARLLGLFGAGERDKTFIPLIVGNRFDLVSNGVSNDPDDSDESDLTALEGCDENDGDL